MKKKNLLLTIGIATGALAGACIYKICKELKSLNGLDDDVFVDEDDTWNEPIKPTERKYFCISNTVRNIKDRFSKECNCSDECDENCTCDCHECESSETCESKCNVNETFHCDFLNCEILTKYESYVNAYLDDHENAHALDYVKRDKIFDVSGEFNVDALKEAFTEEYANIKSIMNSEITGFAVLPMIAHPVDVYLEEIESLRTEENLSRKVNGLLSYWTSISSSKGHGHIY